MVSLRVVRLREGVDARPCSNANRAPVHEPIRNCCSSDAVGGQRTDRELGSVLKFSASSVNILARPGKHLFDLEDLDIFFPTMFTALLFVLTAQPPRS